MASISFSSTGTVTAGYPKQSAIDTIFRTVYRITVVNSEVVTINHGTDVDKVRTVRTLVASTGLDATVGTSGIASYAKTDEDTTTLTFGSGGAGTYIVEISNIAS